MIPATPAPLPEFPKAGQLPPGGLARPASGYRLRPCRNADLPFLRRLYRHARDAELAPTGWPEEMKRAFCEQQFNAQHTDYLRRFPAADYLVIQDGRGPAGRLYVDRSASDLHLIDVSLHPAHQGRGLGTALLRALQELAAQRGGGVTLNVALDNHRAAALYARLGFRPEADGPTHRTLRWTQPPP